MEQDRCNHRVRTEFKNCFHCLVLLTNISIRFAFHWTFSFGCCCWRHFCTRVRTKTTCKPSPNNLLTFVFIIMKRNNHDLYHGHTTIVIALSCHIWILIGLMTQSSQTWLSPPPLTYYPNACVKFSVWSKHIFPTVAILNLCLDYIEQRVLIVRGEIFLILYRGWKLPII